MFWGTTNHFIKYSVVIADVIETGEICKADCLDLPVNSRNRLQMYDFGKFPVHWGGDCFGGYSNMAEALRGGLSLCSSGFGFFSHDIGGFESKTSEDMRKSGREEHMGYMYFSAYRKSM